MTVQAYQIDAEYEAARNAHKATLTAIRGELKKAFPGTKFSVTLNRSGWMKLAQIAWTDGPAQCEVKAIASIYDSSYFDGMDDCTKAIAGRKDTGIEWCTYNRNLSSLKEEIFSFLEMNFIRWRVCAPTEFKEFFSRMSIKAIDWQACDIDDQRMLVRWVAEKSESVPTLVNLYYDTLEF